MVHVHKLLGLVLAGGLLVACGDNGTGGQGGGGSAGSSQGGGGSGPCDGVADGSQAKEQTQGDCKKNICDAGMVTALNDDSDVPDDGNECTKDGCSAGAATSSPEPAGTACKDGACDGKGACVATSCVNGAKDGDETDVDCGGSCSPCEDGKGCGGAADCTSGVCTGSVCQAPACDDGVKNGDETDVDCGGATCPKCEIGKGCGNDDASCIEGAYCEAGTCAPIKAQGEACGGNNACQSGFCTDGVCCDGECAGTCLSCALPGTEGVCGLIPVGQDPDNECAGTDACDGNGACAKGFGATCAAGAECGSGFCVDGVCCDTACNSTCRACTMAKTGQADGTCADVTMGTDPDDECAGALACMAGMCSMPLANGTACMVGGECASGFCADGVCCNSACNGTCTACTMVLKGQGADGTCGFIMNNTDPQNECTGALNCNGSGGCYKAPGAACGSAAECASGFCTDGVCCDSACSGLCKACNVAGMAGTCGFIPAGTDPANECAGAQNCNGAGICQ